MKLLISVLLASVLLISCQRTIESGYFERGQAYCAEHSGLDRITSNGLDYWVVCNDTTEDIIQ